MKHSLFLQILEYTRFFVSVKDIEQKNSLFLLYQLSITLICVPSYDRSYNVYLFPYWFEIGYFSVTTRI